MGRDRGRSLLTHLAERRAGGGAVLKRLGSRNAALAKVLPELGVALRRLRQSSNPFFARASHCSLASLLHRPAPCPPYRQMCQKRTSPVTPHPRYAQFASRALYCGKVVRMFFTNGHTRGLGARFRRERHHERALRREMHRRGGCCRHEPARCPAVHSRGIRQQDFLPILLARGSTNRVLF